MNAEKPKQAGSDRTRAYLEHDRQEGTHPAIESLRRRPHTRDDEGRRAAEYARIERGHEA